MESESIFPVFGELHADDSPSVISPRERPARKVYSNAAGLFVVSADQTDLCEEEQPQTKTGPPTLTGDVAHDALTALYCLAYLKEFFEALESNDLRQFADRLGGERD